MVKIRLLSVSDIELDSVRYNGTLEDAEVFSKESPVPNARQNGRNSFALTAGSPAAGSFACVGSVDQHLACLHIVLKIPFQYLDRTTLWSSSLAALLLPC